MRVLIALLCILLSLPARAELVDGGVVDTTDPSVVDVRSARLLENLTDGGTQQTSVVGGCWLSTDECLKVGTAKRDARLAPKANALENGWILPGWKWALTSFGIGLVFGVVLSAYIFVRYLR